MKNANIPASKPDIKRAARRARAAERAKAAERAEAASAAAHAADVAAAAAVDDLASRIVENPEVVSQRVLEMGTLQSDTLKVLGLPVIETLLNYALLGNGWDTATRTAVCRKVVELLPELVADLETSNHPLYLELVKSVPEEVDCLDCLDCLDREMSPASDDDQWSMIIPSSPMSANIAPWATMGDDDVFC